MSYSMLTGAKTHVPVMLEEVTNFLKISPNGVYVDGTVGAGGHATSILKKLSKEGHLIGIDRDTEALKLCKENLSVTNTPFSLFNDSYSNFEKIVQKLGITQVNGILLDLGLSSIQLDSISRGFSFRYNSELDMRFDLSQNKKAFNIINETSCSDLADLIFNYSEERRSRIIAKKIVAMRPLNTVFDLVEAIRRATPPNYRNKTTSRVFQSIRIAVNNELKNLDKFLSLFYEKLCTGGRIIIISFHSLEDRKVKHAFKKLSKEKKINILTKKPITASARELSHNSRSRSAKMRAAEKI